MPATQEQPGTENADGVHAHGVGADEARPFAAAGANLGEVGAFAAEYASAQFDRVVATARNMALTVVLGAVAAFIALSIAVTSAVLLVVGLAQWVASIISTEPGVGAGWQGNVIVGGGLSVVTVVGVWLVTKWIKSAAFAATVRKYERMDLQRSAADREA
ncbi:MAG: hypothetical protein AAF656_08870, partial [Planctomycetota bacterium]